MPGLSIHVVDVSRGIPAAGMLVDVWRETPPRIRLVAGAVGAGGALDAGGLAARVLDAGVYAIDFHVGDWYRAQGLAADAVPFLDVVPFRFGLADPTQHYHLPLKVTPWGLSLFRGGA